MASAGLGAILRGRDFRLLWGGEFISLLGDQFFVVALAWLVLQLTRSPLAIGTASRPPRARWRASPSSRNAR